MSGTQIDLAWTGSTDNVAVANYRVERCQGAGCTFFVQVATPTGTTFSDIGLQTATRYTLPRARRRFGRQPQWLHGGAECDDAGHASADGADRTDGDRRLPEPDRPRLDGVDGQRRARGLPGRALPGSDVYGLRRGGNPDRDELQRRRPLGGDRVPVPRARRRHGRQPERLLRHPERDDSGHAGADGSRRALSATAVSASQIDLGWAASTDNTGVTGYRVERCQGAGCSDFVQVATPTGPVLNDTGLQAATSYSYRVRAADAAGNLSDYSSVESATTQAATLCLRSSAVWLTGMEHGVVSTAGGGIFSTVTGTPTAVNSVARSGAYSLRIADASSGSTVRALRSVTASSVVVARFAVRLSSLPTVTSNLAYVDSGTDLVFRYNATSQRFQLTLGSSTVNGDDPG